MYTLTVVPLPEHRSKPRDHFVSFMMMSFIKLTMIWWVGTPDFNHSYTAFYKNYCISQSLDSVFHQISHAWVRLQNISVTKIVYVLENTFCPSPDLLKVNYPPASIGSIQLPSCGTIIKDFEPLFSFSGIYCTSVTPTWQESWVHFKSFLEPLPPFNASAFLVKAPEHGSYCRSL